MDALVDGMRFLLIVTFAVSALAKVLSPRPLIERLRAVGLGPIAAAAVYALAAAEGAIALVLISGFGVFTAAAAALGLLALFSASLSRRDGTSDCGCGIPLGDLPTWQLLLRNLVLAAAAALVALGRVPASDHAAITAGVLLLGSCAGVIIVVGQAASSRTSLSSRTERRFA